MDEGQQPRQADRIAIDAEILLRRSFQPRWLVRITDFSTHGCRVDLVERLQQGARLFVSLPGIETLESNAAWVDDFVAGVAFVHPLHPSVFDMLATRMARAA
ncbi:MAG: PilZ domain-containing protein [Sphingomonas bacterium]|nr:PilZ domain-containing protein [Sphingomonas bacterium]